jgi:hypothetical protein
MVEGQSVYKVLVRRPKGKTPLRRPRHRWEDSIMMDLREIGSMGQIGFGWLRIESNGEFL